MKAIINGVSRKINAAVSKASDFAVKASLEDQHTAGLAAAINSAMAAAVSGDRLAFSLTHEVESTMPVVMGGIISTRLISATTASMDSIGAKLVSVVTEITNSAARAAIDAVGD